MARRFVIVAHHEETCGGLMMEWLARLGPCEIRRPLQGQALPSLESVAGAVVLGSHHGVNDPVAGLEEERRWLEAALGHRLPVVGVCFGAQLLAQISGVPVRRATAPERGICPVERLDCPSGHRQWMTVMQWHEDRISRLPNGARLLVQGPGEHAIQAFRLESAVGIQFHPETTPSMLQRWARLPSAPADCLGWMAELENLQAMRAWTGDILAKQFSCLNPSTEIRLPASLFAGRLR